MFKLKLNGKNSQREIPRETLVPCNFHLTDPCFSKPFFITFLVCRVQLVLFFHLVGDEVLITSGHFVKAAVARGRVCPLVTVVVCFQQRGEIRVSPHLLPPGKPSVAVGVAWRRDAEDSDAQVGRDLDAHT